MPRELDEFEWSLVVRPLVIEDYPALVAMQTKCFPGMKPWTRAQIESQLANFPDGQICIELEGALVASSSSLNVEFDDYDAWQDWQQKWVY